jgi:chaperonin GroES
VSLIPVAGKILVRPLTGARVTVSGIHLVATPSQHTNECEVVAINEGRVNGRGIRLPCDFKVGEKLLYVNYVSAPVKHEGEDLLLIDEKDIIGVIED